jgi:hypothetical protein
MDEFIKHKISILARLANIDGDFDVSELAFIYNVGLRNNIDADTIGDLIESPGQHVALHALSASDRIEYLSDVLMLMLVDGKVLPNEVQFCLDIAGRLKFDKGDVGRLIVDLRQQEQITEAYLRERIEDIVKAGE